MPVDQEPPAESVDRLKEIQGQLQEIAEALGTRDARPDDPHKAARYDKSLYWLLSHLSDGIHGLSNFTQALLGKDEQLIRKLDAQSEISRKNLAGISELKRVAADIEESAREIKHGIGLVVRDKPFLMRNVWREPTETTEIFLITIAIGEAAYFLYASDTFVRSVLFQAVARIWPSPELWGLGWVFISGWTVAAWFSRKRILRRIAAGYLFVYFLLIGAAPIVFGGAGALGTYHHLAFCGLALWLLKRGPSNAI